MLAGAKQYMEPRNLRVPGTPGTRANTSPAFSNAFVKLFIKCNLVFTAPCHKSFKICKPHPFHKFFNVKKSIAGII